VFLGPDGAGKSSVIGGLMSHLSVPGMAVKMRHLKPRYVARVRGQQDVIVIDPHGKAPRSAFTSLVKIFVWIFEEWGAALFEERKTLLICDRYYHDLLVDPVRYRFGAPMWAARLVGRVMPQPALWILLSAPTEVLQSRKQEVAPEETARQREAYLAFIATRHNSAIVDASQPIERVIADAEQAILRAVAPGKSNHG
jgi:thymidylate kinase